MAMFLALTLMLGGGCASAVQAGTSTALDGMDLIEMTNAMAAQIGSDPEVRRAIADHGPLEVVVLPVENRMTAEVLPRGAAEAFTGRVRTLLSWQMPDDFIWVMNRDTYYRLRGMELEGVELGPSPEATNPRYALHATFTNLIREDRRGRSAYYLCVYQLTDLSGRNILWTGRYELKRVAVRGFLD